MTRLLNFKYLILFVFALALFTRFWKITEYPVSLTIDEVAIGVSARAIAATGRDEMGHFLPLAFESVGDYKPPVDVYLTVPSIALFGLNKFAVRFPVALIGAMSAPLAALLLQRLKFSKHASLLGGIWLALSPWSIHYSRASFEAITSLTLILAGVYCFLSWLDTRKQRYLFASVITFSLSVWAYHSSRVFVPILFGFLILLFRKEIQFKNCVSQITKAGLILLLFALPFVNLLIFSPAIRTRAQSTSILREQSLLTNLQNGEYETASELVFDNDIYKIYRHWLGKYLNYFDLRFIFWDGMEFTKPGYPDVGLVYLVDLFIITVGIYALVKSKNSKLKTLALFWFLAGPLAASFTMNEQHPLRSLVWLPAFLFLAASGFEYLLKNKKKTLLILYFVGLTINVAFAWDIYTKQFPYFKSEHWQFGYEEVAQYACEKRGEYKQIFVSESFGAENMFTSVPHYYLSFYCGGVPSDYTKADKSLPGISIKRPLWEVDKFNHPNSLFIAAPWDFPIEKVEPERIVKKLEFKDGKTSFVFVETNKK